MTKRKRVGPVDPMAVVTRFIDAANHHDVDALRACVHREFESVQPIHPGRNFRGPGQLISNWRAIFEAEPGFRLSVRRAAVTENTVWVEVHGAGASAEAAGIFIVGIEDGRIRWIRVYSDLVEPVPEPPEPPEPAPAVQDEASAPAAGGDGEGEDGAPIRLIGEAGAEPAGAHAGTMTGDGEMAGAGDGEEPVPALTLVQPATEGDAGGGIGLEGDGITGDVAAVDDPATDDVPTDETAGDPVPATDEMVAVDDAATDDPTDSETDGFTGTDTADSIWAARPDELPAPVPAATATGEEPAEDLPDVGDTVAGLGFTEPELEAELGEPQPSPEAGAVTGAPAEAPDRAPGSDEALVPTPETSDETAADAATAIPSPPEPVTTWREHKPFRRRWWRGRGD